jgi:hypothetical protein
MGQSIRTVAVVGAGASLPILAAAKDLADELEQELGGRDSVARGEFLLKMEDLYKIPQDSFEARLMALCRTPEDEQAVRDAIAERYRFRHPTVLGYDLVAHLMHHRFLDTVISFNFDELLDQSIEDELGPNEFTQVVSERDFDPGDGVEGPLYVKLHGTASEPHSLRFSEERYFDIPKSIEKLVEQRFDVDHLIILNLGYSMKNVDFQYLLRKPKEVEIFNLDPEFVTGEVVNEIEKLRRPERERRRRPVERSQSYDAPIIYELGEGHQVDGGGGFLGSLLSEVVQTLELTCDSNMAGPTHWRSIQRHLTLVTLLKEYDTSDKRHQAAYLRRRAILEIAFAAAKGRGVVSIASMVDDRCGRYYDLYAQKAAEPEGWPTICQAGGLQENKSAPDTYEVIPQLLAGGGEEDGDIHSLRLADPGKLADHTVRSLDIGRWGSKERKEAIALLAETLSILQKDTEIEIHSCDDRVCSKIFAEPGILKSLTALRGWTRELLQSPRYNEVWAVAETGEWLAEEDIDLILRSKCEKVKLLRAFEGSVPVEDDLFEIRKVPWGRHNRHMTILCENGEPRSAIYFARRLRAATVTPVHLSHPTDMERMVNAFGQLWREAGEYENETQKG